MLGGQQASQVGRLRVAEQLLGRALLLDATLVQVDHTRGHLAGKAHLVGDHDHGAALLAQFADHPQHLTDQLGVIRELGEEGRTMIMVTHEMRFAREVSSRVVYLHQGRIEEQGTPEQLFGDPQSANLRRLLATQH